MQRLPSCLHGNTHEGHLSDRSREKEKTQETWRDNRKGKQVAVEL